MHLLWMGRQKTNMPATQHMLLAGVFLRCFILYNTCLDDARRGTRLGKEMNVRRKTIRLVVLLALVLLTAPLAAYAQPSTKVYRLGYLRGGRGYGAEDEAFKQRLRELGYAEGQNLVIEARFAQGELERYPAFAAELVQLKVDCLVVGGIPAIHAAQQATSTIPIVMINVGVMILCIWDSSPASRALEAISPASWTSQRN